MAVVSPLTIPRGAEWEICVYELVVSGNTAGLCMLADETGVLCICQHTFADEPSDC